eukprot:695310-Prorocentrum_minimum.AAC.1
MRAGALLFEVDVQPLHELVAVRAGAPVQEALCRAERKQIGKKIRKKYQKETVRQKIGKKIRKTKKKIGENLENPGKFGKIRGNWENSGEFDSLGFKRPMKGVRGRGTVTLSPALSPSLLLLSRR